MTDDAALRNAALCDQVDWPSTGYTYDSAYPNVTADNVWHWLIRYLLDGTLPPGTRVFCGVTIPGFPLDPPN